MKSHKQIRTYFLNTTNERSPFIPQIIYLPLLLVYTILNQTTVRNKLTHVCWLYFQAQCALQSKVVDHRKKEMIEK